MDDEERANLIEAVVSSRGWKEIIRPALDTRRDALMDSLLDANDEFVEYQQGVKAIDNLLLFIAELEHKDSKND
jgi:hypothetical protein